MADGESQVGLAGGTGWLGQCGMIGDRRRVEVGCLSQRFLDRGCPFGDDEWTDVTAWRFGCEFVKRMCRPGPGGKAAASLKLV